jgi:small multidrug resistance pump
VTHTRFMTRLGWPLLIAAILFEVGGTVSMKMANGFTKPLPSVLMFIFYGLCLGSLEFAVGEIDLNVLYAVWSGLGTAIIAAIGIYWFQEKITLLKLVSLGLIIAGVIGLNLRSS